MLGINTVGKFLEKRTVGKESGNRKLVGHALTLFTAIIIVSILAYLSQPFTIDFGSLIWPLLGGLGFLGLVFYASNALEHAFNAYRERGLPSFGKLLSGSEQKSETQK